MIGRWPLALSLAVGLCAFWSQLGWVQGERWSRQVSNSDWIPLASPRTHTGQSQLTQSGGGPANPHFSQVQPLALPPALQQQYQQQLMQLQKTQESIQNLLLLQQQLRTQQQLLQAQAFLPNGLNKPEENKQALHQSTFANLQSVSDLAPEVLIPPVPSSDALPPVYPPQRFLSQNPSSIRYSSKTNSNVAKSQGSEEEIDEGSREEDSSKEFNAGQSGQYENENGQREKNSPAESSDENEEVQLVYVPAETLAQRSQANSQRGRSRKQYQHQNQNQEKSQVLSELESSTPRASTLQQDFARQILQQLQRDQLTKNRMVQEERLKEVARLEEEQKELDRQARLHQEAVFREQELQRQRKAEKQKELEHLEAIAKQEELQRIRELREKQRLEQERQSMIRRQEEIQRQEEIRSRQEQERTMAELQAREESEREARRKEEERLMETERLAVLQRQKEAEIQKGIERTIDQDKAIGSNSDVVHGRHHAEALVRNPQHQTQHLTENTRQKSRVRGRQRVRGHATTDNQDTHGTQGSQTSQGSQSPQDNQDSSGVTSSPSPNQPPLSVYMGHINMDPKDVKVSDVLKLLKDARTISVLDSVGPEAPSVFVGPSNLDPPNGFAKFDLPYLSSIENNRVERKVDKLPFFVAPLSFNPPPGYSKIPFPSPHIGSVVVNTVDNELSNAEESKQESQVEITDDRIINRHRIRPNPLIEPNSYTAGTSGTPAEVTPSPAYSRSTAPTYDTGYSTTPTSGSRYRYRQFYGDNRPAAKNYENNNQANHQVYSSTTSSPSSYQEELIDPNHKNHKPYYTEALSATTTPSYSDSTSGVQEEPTKQQDLAAQLALINQELAHQHYNNPEVQEVATGSGNTIQNTNRFQSVNQGQLLNKFNRNERPDHIDEVAPTGISQDTRAILTGPTQYTLPADLPVISSHLPGLVNSLIDSRHTEHQGVSSTSPPPTTTIATTTTTTEAPTTTHRIRGRQRGRVTSTRPTTSTQSPSTHSNTDRPRRPYSRSRSRFTTTTTEGYSEPAYQPTKSKISETTQRYGVQDHTRKSNGSSENRRGQRYRGRGGEKNIVNSELPAQRPKIVAALNQETVSYGTTAPADVPQEPSAPAINPNVPIYNTQDDYPSSTPGPSPRENYSSITESTLNPASIPKRDLTESNGAESWSGESSQVQKYREDVNPTENVPYAGFQSSGNFGQPHLEDNPVNGFNYQAQTMESLPTPTMSYRPKEQSYDREKISSSTETPVKINSDINPTNYEAAALQGNFGPQPVQEYFPREESLVPDQGLSYDNNTHPNREEYPQRILSSGPSEEILSQTTTTTTTTPVPPTNVGRQRVRGRVGGRVQHDSLIQTRPRDGQDEYVRFSPINQDGPRRRLKTRPRVRSQQAHRQVQTDENEYVRIQASTQYHRPTTRTTTTSTTTTTTQQPEAEIEYGFIRPPNFQPVHPVVMNYPTFVPENNQYQEQVVEDTASGEAHPVRAEILKHRQTYQLPPRRATIKSTTVTPQAIITPRISSTAAAAAEEESVFTVKTKIRSEEPKVTRVRGRIRRPGKKRLNITTSTTTTTEIPADDNELPIDENYPRTLQTNPETIPRQDNLNRPSLENHGELSLLHNRPSGSLHQVEPNDNSEDFLINFGGVPNAELAEREEYDQTQLASNRAKNYYQESKGSGTRYSAVTDIEGAESQWSSKLTRSSFQPSYLPNRLANDEVSNDSKDFKRHSTHQEYPEIITAGPEVQSITVLVSAKQSDEIQDESIWSNHERKDTFPEPDENPTKIDSSIEHENISGMEDIFGKKMQEDATSLDTTVPTESTDTVIPTTPLIPTTITDVSDNDKTVMDTTKIVKKTYLEYPLDRKILQRDRTKRRRVRVRVRPVSDDFVTAESHRYTSVVNSLGEDRYVYRLEKTTTEKPEQSILDEFFQEMLKTDKSLEPSTTVETTLTDVATTTKEPLTTTETILLPSTMNDNVQDSENVLTTPAGSIILDTEDDDYPKNHRSKWSEVQDLTKHSNLDYSKIASWIPRNANFSKETIVHTQVSTSVPETKDILKSDVKVLSDYVKAIFERLKGEETTPENNMTMTTTDRMVPEEDKVLKKEEMEDKIKTDEHVVDDNNNIIDEVKSTTQPGTTEPMSTLDPTEDTTVVEIVSTTPNVPVPPDELTTEILGMTTTESPLGRILRTSTTTKVSHMTEICYRGRCVMTKPRKEINAR